MQSLCDTTMSVGALSVYLSHSWTVSERLNIGLY